MRKFNLSKYALECFSNNILKVSGIVDKPQGELSDIFEPGSITLKSVVKNNIDLALSRIQEFLDKTYAGIKVTRHEIIGAAVTFQYTDTSDIDTTVFININRSDPRFKSINNWIGTYIDGKMTYKNNSKEIIEDFISKVPLKKLGKPEDIAKITDAFAREKAHQMNRRTEYKLLK